MCFSTRLPEGYPVPIFFSNCMLGQKIYPIKNHPQIFILSSLKSTKSLVASFVVAINPYGFNVGDPNFYYWG